jgi:hypothetical protein
MNATPAEIEKYLNLLTELPQRISKATHGTDDAHLQFNANEKTWSVNDILAHLRSCADVWGDSVEAMLAEDNPKVPYRHPRQWIKKTNYLKLSFQESFRAFQAQRKKFVKALKGLSFEDWSRAAIIKGREHTVFTQVRRMATHEREHVEQMEALLESGADRQ